MSRETNKAFLANPQEFATQTPIKAPGTSAAENQVKTWQETKEVFKGVPGKLRIIAGDLTKLGDYATLELNYDQVDAKIEAGWMAMYYLPWLPDNHVRTTLRPRSFKDREDKTTDRGAKLTGVNGYQENSNDPDIFFTAAVNGCMVSVTGSEQEPTVYHSNAVSCPTQTHIGSEDDERIVSMTKDVSSFMEIKPKALRNMSDQPKPRGVTAAMYMPKQQQDQLLNKGYQPLTEKRRIKDAKLLGTIFGKRTEGKWAFYYERLVAYDDSLLTKQMQREPVSAERIEGKLVVTYANVEVEDWVSHGLKYRLDGPIQEFWPKGTGKVLFN